VSMNVSAIRNTWLPSKRLACPPVWQASVPPPMAGTSGILRQFLPTCSPTSGLEIYQQSIATFHIAQPIQQQTRYKEAGYQASPVVNSDLRLIVSF
jgi:hypothetical protein